MRFRDVGAGRHGASTVHGERSSSKVSDLDALKSDDRLVRHGKVFGGLAPEGQSDGELRSVDEGEISLGDLERGSQESGQSIASSLDG